MAVYRSEFVTDIAKPFAVRPIAHQMAAGDADAYEFTVLVADSRAPETGLMAGSVSGAVVRPDGGTVVITGEKGTDVRTVQLPEGECNATPCTITIPQAALAYPGRVVIVIRLLNDTVETTVLAASATVARTLTGTVIDPGEAVPDITALLAQIQACKDATDAAEAVSETTLGNFAPEFDAAEAKAAGAFVTYAEDGKLYLLPEGHTAGTSWANTTHTETDFGAEVSSLKSHFRQLALATLPPDGAEPMHYIPLDGFEAGKINDSTGKPEADPNNRIWRTAPLPVWPDRQIHFETMQEIALKYFWYDATGDYLSGSSSWQAGNRSGVDIPTNAAFVRVCALYASGSTYAAPTEVQRAAIFAFQIQDVQVPTGQSAVFVGAGMNSSSGRMQSNYSNIRAVTRLNKTTGSVLSVYTPFGYICTGIYQYGADLAFIERNTAEYAGIGKYQLATGTEFVRINIKKSNNGTITAADLATLNSGVTITFSDTTADTIGRPAEGWELLHVAAFQQGATTAGGYSSSNYRISSSETVGLPMGSARVIHGVIDSAYVLGMRCGAHATNLSSALYFYTGEFDITIPDTACYYRLYVARSTGDATHETDTIAPKTADELCLRLWWKRASDILTENDEARKILTSARLKMATGSTPNELTLPMILHTSDAHGDYHRMRSFFDFADAVHPDAACVTGDVVSYYGSHGLTWFKAMVNGAACQPAFCVGNHETQESGTTYPTDAEIYTRCFDGIAAKLGNTTGKTWYYKDLADKSLRIISVNLYQDGSQTETGGYRFHTHLLSDQMTWLVETLSSTPAGYGIILLTHAPQRAPSGLVHDEDNPFYQRVKIADSTHSDIDGAPIYDLIDAFIGRTTISQTYTQKGTPSSITVTADFSGVDASVEFIAHLNGHTHEDFIGYVQNAAHKQLVLCVTCTAALTGGTAAPYIAGLTDQGRSLDDSTQDAFNAYAIDRKNKAVRVVRIGANMTYDMQERKHMIIKYAD